MIRAGIEDWWFCGLQNCNDSEETRLPHAGGKLWTRLWLERWKRDTRKCRELRQTLAQAHLGRPVHRYTDEEVVDQIALLIERGVIHIHAAAARVGTAEATREGGQPVTPPAFPLSERRAPSNSQDSSSDPNDPATFASAMDPDAQVAALVAAASQGAPFCPI
jgi:hypothetical protein